METSSSTREERVVDNSVGEVVISLCYILVCSSKEKHYSISIFLDISYSLNLLMNSSLVYK
jgi:hypothetical protein